MISFQSDEHRQKRAAEHAFGYILDIGYAQIPNEYLRGHVTGLDINLPEKKPLNYSTTIQGDINKIAKTFGNNSFDTITALEILEHVDSHLSFFRDAKKVLKPKGKLVISTPNPYYYRTLIGNIYFPYGKTGVTDHVSVYIPRILNSVAETSGFRLRHLEKLGLIPLSIMSYQLLYVYESMSSHP